MRRTRNNDLVRQFDQMENERHEQQMFLQDMAAGRIMRKDIPKYMVQNPNFKGLGERTFLGANSHISFEELSASDRHESIRSANQASLKLKTQTSLMDLPQNLQKNRSGKQE